jgi:hypothetical protein
LIVPDMATEAAGGRIGCAAAHGGRPEISRHKITPN